MGMGTWLLEMSRGILNIFQHQIVAVLLFVSIWTPIFTMPTTSLIWHVVLCSIGIFPFLIEGLAVLGYDLIYAIELEERTRGIIHAVLMSLGALFITVGGIVEMSSSRLSSHFSSSHGVLGLICVILILLSFLLGFFAKFAKTFGGYAKPVVFQFVHNLIGILTVIIGISCMCTGYYLNEFLAIDETKVAGTVVACILMLWSLSTAFYKLYKQISAIFL